MKNKLKYGMITEGFFHDNREEVEKYNSVLVHNVLMDAMIINVLFVVMSVLSSAESFYVLYYFVFSLLFVAGFLMFSIWEKRILKILSIFYTIIEILLFAETLPLCTFLVPDQRAVTVLLVMMVLSTIYIELPIKSLVIEIVEIFVFVVMAYIYKTPEIFIDDVLATVIMFIGSIGLIYGVKGLNIRTIASNAFYQQQSQIDQLTHIFNKSTTENMISEYLRNHKEMSSLFVVDIDEFKRINDTMGHAKGDEVLRKFASAIKDIFQGRDIIGRIGGDEFVVFAKGMASKKTINKKMNELRIRLREIFENEKITCSVGVCLTSEGTYYHDCFILADKALYDAKREGKDCILITDSYKGHKDVMIIADDSESSRAILRGCFEDSFSIIEACNGQEVLDYLQLIGIKVKIILLDVEMPVKSGAAVLEEMGKDTLLRDIPVVVISAYGDREVPVLQLGAKDMIEKPFDMEVVKLRVENAIK